MRKSKKTIAIIASIAMVLMMIPVQAFAADNSSATARLAGTDRVGTAIAIANNGWANGAANVVVAPANDENLVDALAVAPLAKQLNAPTLITDKNSLDANVSAEISTLKASNIYAVGALSDAVISQLKAISGVTVTQIKGTDRMATAAQIASKLTSPAGSFVVGYNGLADALSVASYAAANNYAILVANTDGTVPANEAAFEGAKVIELGGPTLVSDIAGATRYYGADRYATNDQVIKNLSFKYDKVYVANGETLVDALSGAGLAAMTNSPIVLANTQGAAAAADVHNNMTSGSQVVAFGGSAVVPDSVVSAIQTGTTTPASGPVSVASVKAVAANQIQVAFSAAPADTSKVEFDVAVSGTPVTVTPTWSADKTQAVLQGSANFAPGTYTVDVKNDTTDLGSNTVTFTQQQIAKIDITSKVMAVTTLTGSAHNSDGVADGSGFITYTVQDQYGTDITNSALANGITWTPGISSTFIAKDGVVEITPPSNGNGGTTSFNQYTSMSITGYDSTSGVSASATLPIQSTGTLSGITLNKLISPNNDDFNAGNTSGQWYIDYTALDASGNSTSNFDLVNEGILNNQSINGGGYLNVSVVKDPNDNSKAALSVTINSTNVGSLVTDTQIPITVVTTNGKSSTLNVTLKKANNVESVTLTPPTQMVASGETVNIPFTATDPTGAPVTDYTKLNGYVTLTASSGTGTTPLTWQRNADGSASIQYVAPDNQTNSTMTVYLSATVTATGKFSQLTLSIQKPVTPDSLNVDTTKSVQFMQAGSSQSNDFGAGVGYGGFSIMDQYGRVMNIGHQDDTAAYYYVVPTSSNPSVLSVSGMSYNGNAITLNAQAAGTATVTYEVWKAAANTNPNVSDATNDKDMNISKTVTYTVVKDSDITGYTMDSVANPLYMLKDAQISQASMAYTGQYIAKLGTTAPTEYGANVYVWGKTAGGAKVVLNPAKIAAVSIDSSDFKLDNPLDGSTTASTVSNPGVNNFVVYAHDITESNPSTTSTSSSTNLTATVIDNSGNYVNVTQPIKSTTDSSVVSKMGYFVLTGGYTGITTSGNTATLNLSDTSTLMSTTADTLLNQINYKNLTRYNADGTKTNRGAAYFQGYDQFNTKDGAVSLVSVTASSFATSGVTANVVKDGSGNPVLQINYNGSQATAANITNGDYIVLSAVSGNGQLSTFKVLFQK